MLNWCVVGSIRGVCEGLGSENSHPLPARWGWTDIEHEKKTGQVCFFSQNSGPPPKTSWFRIVNFLWHVMFDMGWFYSWLEQNPNFASTLPLCVTHQKAPYSWTASSLVQQQVLLVPGQLCMLRANAFEVSLQHALFLGTPKSRSMEEVCFVLLDPTVMLVDIRSGLWFHSQSNWHS